MFLILYFSFASFLLLVMPTNKAGIILSGSIALIGVFLFLIFRKYIQNIKISLASVFGALVIVPNFGIHFYKCWLPSSKVDLVASAVHISKGTLLYGIAITLCLFSSIIISVTIKLIDEHLHIRKHEGLLLRNIVCILVTAVFLVSISQIMISEDIFSMGFIKFIVGCIIVSCLILTIYIFLDSVKGSIVIVSLVIMLISTINVYIYQFRNRLFDPIDMGSFRTAYNVMDNYSLFPVPWRVVISWAAYLFFIGYLLRGCLRDKYKLSIKSRIKIFVSTMISVVFLLLYVDNLKTYHWLKEGATYNGYVLNYTSAIKEIYVKKPEGYTVDYIDSLALKYSVDNSESTDRKIPNIIVIMDESFSDLAVNGDFKTNNEVTPFIDSLVENTVSGYALASVYGGNTANSEFEFLTGNTMAWLSPNIVPYQQYLKKPTYSIVSYLKKYYNYRCIAFHPYLADGWNRVEAYKNLGFDKTYFLEDFPQKQLVRQYVSDQEMFETMIDLSENNDDQPLFLFGVTMQNHGDYYYAGDNYEDTIKITDKSDYKDVDQYLSLIHETDKAVEYLIDYLENSDEDFILVFFGDHQPIVEDEFLEEIDNKNDDRLTKLQHRYSVPFFVFANYDIEEQKDIHTSINYLSNYIYDIANIRKSPYNQFLSEMEQRIGAINSNGYYSETSHCYSLFEDATDEEKRWLNMYQNLQYNNIIDLQNHNSVFFPVDFSRK